MASMQEIHENTKMAREYALLGNYETSQVYYQGVLQQVQKLLRTIDDPSRKQKWQEVSRIKHFSNSNCFTYISTVSI